MHVNTKIQSTNNRKYNTKNMHNVTVELSDYKAIVLNQETTHRRSACPLATPV